MVLTSDETSHHKQGPKYTIGHCGGLSEIHARDEALHPSRYVPEPALIGGCGGPYAVPFESVHCDEDCLLSSKRVSEYDVLEFGNLATRNSCSPAAVRVVELGLPLGIWKAGV